MYKNMGKCFQVNVNPVFFQLWLEAFFLSAQGEGDSDQRISLTLKINNIVNELALILKIS